MTVKHPFLPIVIFILSYLIKQPLLTLSFKAYARNYPRSGLARQFVLAGRTPTGYLPDLYTDNFWDEVDSVTTSILSLLLPLINILGALGPRAGWPPLTKVHQDLHNIVAEAGWLTNGMRVSKSVFWVQFPAPGDLWDIHQEHATDSLWKASKAAAEAHDARAMASWRVAMETEWLATGGGQPIDDTWRREYARLNPPPGQPRRAAKVQVVMWPWINRYTPVRPRSDGDLNSGETITQIVKAQIVYYAGDDSDEGDMQERLTLAEHMRAYRRRWTSNHVFVYFLVSLFVTWLSHEAYYTLDLQGVTARVRTTDFVVAETPLGVSTATVTETATGFLWNPLVRDRDIPEAYRSKDTRQS